MLLVAVLGCLLALAGWLLVTPAAPVAAANTLHVTDCGDAGANTLRGKIGAAVAGTRSSSTRTAGASAITLATGTLTLTQNVTIDGTGHTVVVDGGCTANCGTESAVGGVTVFTVNGGVTANLNALTIQHGNTAGLRRRHQQRGTLTVTNSTLTGNSAATSSAAAASRTRGTLTVTNSTIAGNSASGGGGGIDNSSGTVAR